MSIGTELQKIPRAFGYSVAGLMDLERGYTEVSLFLLKKLAEADKQYIISGPRDDPRTKALLEVVRRDYRPAKVVIQLDPTNPPLELAKVNGVVESLLSVIKSEEPSLRICENGACQMPIFDADLAKEALA